MDNYLLVLIGCIVVLASRASLAAAMEDVGKGGAPRKRGLIVNQSTDALVDYLPLPGPLEATTPPETVIEGFHKIIDQYAGTQVSHIFLNTNFQRTAYPSEVWESYWDVPNPETDTSGWPRKTWLVHRTGVDLYAVCIQRCREVGISPWLSIRMNDTHYSTSDDPTKMSRLWWDHPEWRLPGTGMTYNGFNFAVKEVRDHSLALIGELLERYDADGLELDWMRFPCYFKRGEEAEGREKLTQFVRQCRRLADQAAARRGHPVGIAARVPAVPDFAIGLGLDGVTWAREGLVDILILSSVWRPSDTDQPIEEWRRRIGEPQRDLLIAAGTDLWIQSAPGGPLMTSNVESMRGFSAAMLERGADLIYLFNHFHHGPHKRIVRTPEGGEVVKNDYADIMRQTGQLETCVDKPRRHVVTWHDPAPYGVENPRQLPATVSPEQSATFRVYTGPRPASGRVILRAGLDDLPGMAEARLCARLNGVECKPIEDLARDRPFRPEGEGGGMNRVVYSVADVAPRVVQFDAPLRAVRRGYNAVEIFLKDGKEQKVIWMEIYIVP